MKLPEKELIHLTDEQRDYLIQRAEATIEFGQADTDLERGKNTQDIYKDLLNKLNTFDTIYPRQLDIFKRGAKIFKWPLRDDVKNLQPGTTFEVEAEDQFERIFGSENEAPKPQSDTITKQELMDFVDAAMEALVVIKKNLKN